MSFLASELGQIMAYFFSFILVLPLASLVMPAWIDGELWEEAQPNERLSPLSLR